MEEIMSSTISLFCGMEIGGIKWPLVLIWWFLEPYSESSQFSIYFESSTAGSLCWESGLFQCGCHGLSCRRAHHIEVVIDGWCGPKCSWTRHL